MSKEKAGAGSAPSGAGAGRSSAEHETTEIKVDVLEDRVSRLEFLRSFQTEILNTIRVYSTRPDYTLEKCLQDIVDFIQQRFSLYVTCVFLRDEIAEELVLYVASGDRNVLPYAKQFRLKVGHGLTSVAIRTGQMVVENDVDLNPVFVRGPLLETKSEVCIPLYVKNKVIGVFDLEDRERNKFNKDIVSLMEQVAVYISLLIECKMLYDESMRNAEKLQQKVSDSMKQLHEQENRYQSFVENVQLPLLMIDPNGYITWANEHSAKFLGTDKVQIMGENISRFVKKGHMYKIYTLLSNISEGKSIKEYRIQMQTASNEDKTVEVVPSVIPSSSTRDIAIIFRDVTEKMIVEKLKFNYLKTLEEEVRKRVSEIKDVQHASIIAIASLAESIDNYTYGHLQRIRSYSKLLALQLKKHPKYQDIITDEYADLIYDLSPLHDIGKVGIKDSVLQKEGALSDEEFAHIKEHTEIGGNALKLAGQLVNRESIFAIGEMIARFHHQKWDGTGYPHVDINGEKRPLKGDEIPLCARIVSLADVYDALSSARPYKSPYPHDVAKKMILEQRGTNFDPEVVDAFLECEEEILRIREQFPDDKEITSFRPSERDSH